MRSNSKKAKRRKRRNRETKRLGLQIGLGIHALCWCWESFADRMQRKWSFVGDLHGLNPMTHCAITSVTA